MSGPVGSESDEVEAPDRGETDAERKWRCPECGHEEKRHHSSRTRPFCEPCDWQFGVLLEMDPIGPGSEEVP